MIGGEFGSTSIQFSSSGNLSTTGISLILELEEEDTDTYPLCDQ